MDQETYTPPLFERLAINSQRLNGFPTVCKDMAEAAGILSRARVWQAEVPVTEIQWEAIMASPNKNEKADYLRHQCSMLADALAKNLAQGNLLSMDEPKRDPSRAGMLKLSTRCTFLAPAEEGDPFVMQIDDARGEGVTLATNAFLRAMSNCIPKDMAGQRLLAQITQMASERLQIVGARRS